MAYSPEQETVRKRNKLWKGWEEAQLGPAVPLHWYRAPQSYGYRNRLRLQVLPEGEIAFFNTGKVAQCLVVEPTVLEGMRKLQALACNRLEGWQCVTHLELRARDARGNWGLQLNGKSLYVLERLGCSLGKLLGPDWLVGVQGASSVPHQQWALPESVYALVPLDAFIQVNTTVNSMLVQVVVDIARQTGTGDFIDLFMGAGNFSLPLLAAGLTGCGVESHRGAVVAAQQAAAEQHLSFEQVEAGPAEQSVRRWVAQGRRANLVVSDPPRAGLRQLAPQVAALAADNLVLCSCVPSSLWRDVDRFLSLGFSVRQLAAFEMFPRTDHLEVLAWLVRN